MVVRNIIKIDEAKCDGCGKCVIACAQGAIEIINGKAKLVSDVYCDGLGVCIGHCPQGAITVEKRQAQKFDRNSVQKRQADTEPTDGVCPGTLAHLLQGEGGVDLGSGDLDLKKQWPVQLKLVPEQAGYFKDSDLLVVADCVPFAMDGFREKLLKDTSVVIGCPKLDDAEFYVDKLAQIIWSNSVRSITVAHMEVLCCTSMVMVAKNAIERAGVDLELRDITISLDGQIKEDKVNATNTS